ncbi:unnamed protein product [Anisakis simplex]|uniref:Cystatin domain-containing protein n=1 Tax=Anisakis simplex TaxID=6269 RepID=A0A0M3K5Y5_ANISI|nr:unnamed protein product [Anisakis simplex]
MSWRAIDKLNQQSNDAYHWILVEVRKARIQLVAGYKYTIDAIIAQSNCPKNVCSQLILYSLKKLIPSL